MLPTYSAQRTQLLKCGERDTDTAPVFPISEKQMFHLVIDSSFSARQRTAIAINRRRLHRDGSYYFIPLMLSNNPTKSLFALSLDCLSLCRLSSGSGNDRSDKSPLQIHNPYLKTLVVLSLPSSHSKLLPFLPLLAQ